MSAKGLGKGFGSLLPENFDSSVMLSKGERVQKIAIENITPNPDQPRRVFDSVAIDQLAESIKRYGVLQPLVVTEAGDNFVIIAGERRYRAAKKAGLSHLPVLVRTLEAIERLEIGLIENIQRVDLSPMEQAISIARLNEQFGMSLPDIAQRLGKAHTTIVNMVRLLQLPAFARKSLENNDISEGHARAVLALKGNTNSQKFLVSRIVRDGWSVRQAESYVKRIKSDKKSSEVATPPDTTYTKTALRLESKMGAKVKIISKKQGVQLQINFKTNKNFTQFLKELES